MGIDGKTAAGSVATTMAGIGPGIGTVGPVSNFAHLPGAGKLVLSFLMLAGRLEIYTVIMLFTPAFWRN
jgi:trk system potassium uptake protein TrkH